MGTTERLLQVGVALFGLFLSSGAGPVQTLIYGGTEAVPGDFPWMVSIQLPKSDYSGFGHTCGGTLISNTTVVTAAHCARSIFLLPPDRKSRVAAGLHSLNASSNFQQNREISYQNIYVHYLYNKDNAAYDIAIIEVWPPFEETERVGWVPLPSTNLSSSGVCNITGWGATEYSATSNVLIRAEVPIVSKNSCQYIYGDQFHPETQICAGMEQGGVDACYGDTGGPIICEERQGRPFFAGVASSGYFCGQPGRPGIYTEISRLIDWIENPSMLEEVELIFLEG